MARTAKRIEIYIPPVKYWPLFDKLVASEHGNRGPWDSVNAFVLESPSWKELDLLHAPETARALILCSNQFLQEMVQKGWTLMNLKHVGNRLAALMAPPRIFHKPMWKGERGRLLIHNDWGYGDEFYHLRYLRSAMDRCDVIYEARTAVCRLVKSFGCSVIRKGDVIPDHDFQIALRDIEKVVGAVATAAYIPVTTAAREFIGCCWRGSKLKMTERRAFPEDFFRSLAEKSRSELVSFQRDQRIEWGKNLATGDWLDTATNLARCKFLLTVDTGVAHLAGGMGLDVLVLYPLDLKLFYDETSYPRLRVVRGKVPEICLYVQQFLDSIGG